MNNKTLLVGLVSLGLLVTALITRNGQIAWMMLPFLAYLGTGLLQSVPAEKLHLGAARRLQYDRTGEESSIQASLSVQNQGQATLQVCLHESLQDGMKVTGGELSRRVELRAGESAALQYTFTAARGEFSWQSVHVLVSDPLSLVQSELSLPAGASIQVRPQGRRFKAIRFRPHSTLHSPGSIPAGLGGSGTDFFGVREYQPGDPLRRLDWRLTARHPHKFFSKEFEQEEIADIGLILDARQGSELRVGAHSLFEACLEATASLAEMFLHQGHRVSLFVFGETALNVFPGYGKTQLQRVLGCLSKARVGTGNRALASLDFIPIRMFPSRALLIVLSPLSPADRSLFLRLRAYGYQAVLISPDPIDFASPNLARDRAGKLAIRAARIERRLRLNDIAQMQIPVIDWRLDEALFPLLQNAMARPRGQRE